MRYTLLTILLLLTGCSSLGQAVITADDKLDDIKIIQEDSKLLSDKYINIAPVVVDGVKLQSHPFVTPDGKKGYFIYENKEDKTYVYTKTIECIDGVCKDFDWEQITKEHLNKALGL